jgi:hypothetical protein
MDIGGISLGDVSSGGTAVEQNSPVRKRAEDAVMSPKERKDTKGSSASPTKEYPEAPDNTDAESIKVEVNFERTSSSPRSESSKMNISPIRNLANLADAQYDVPLENVPMPTSLMEFTKEHWDTLVTSPTAFKGYVCVLIVRQCHNNNILKGVRMEDTGPNPSTANVVEPLSMDDIHYALNDLSRTEYTTTYTERSSKYANHGWTTKALLVTIPW